MTATIHTLPIRSRKRTEGVNGNPCSVIQMQPVNAKVMAMRLYKQASDIDQTFPRAGADLYERVLLLDPTFALAIVNLGLCHFRLGNERSAEACWVEGAEQGVPAAFYNLAWLRSEGQRFDEAIGLYRRTIMLDPKFPDAHFNLGLALERVGKVRESREAFRAYLDLEPSEAQWSDMARKKLGQ